MITAMTGLPYGLVARSETANKLTAGAYLATALYRPAAYLT